MIFGGRGGFGCDAIATGIETGSSGREDGCAEIFYVYSVLFLICMIGLQLFASAGVLVSFISYESTPGLLVDGHHIKLQ